MKILVKDPVLPSENASLYPGLAAGSAVMFLFVTAASLLKLHGFDFAILHALNSFSAESAFLNHGAHLLTKDMFSNLLMVSLVWFAWFDTQEHRDRASLLAGTVVSYGAGVVSRVLQLVLPSHLRPLHDPALGFHPPVGLDPDTLNHWNSFPSDHAAVFFGLATTIFIVSRELGAVAFMLALCFGMTRIYLGYHYPSDIVAGAMLGIFGVAISKPVQASALVRRLLFAEQSHRPWFYAISFYVCFGISTLFGDYRTAGIMAAHMLKAYLPHG